MTLRNKRGVYSPDIWQDREQAGHQFSTDTMPGIAAVYSRWPEGFVTRTQSEHTHYHLRM